MDNLTIDSDLIFAYLITISISILDLQKRIELKNWVLENIKNPEINICELIESKMNKIIDTVNKMDSAIEADPLHTELRILDWILYRICGNEITDPDLIADI